MVKAHTPINWENEPSYNTPLNAANLNKMDSEIGILDDRIIEQDTIKLDKATANTMVKAISFDENTGVFTITLLNGSTTTIDTKLEKVVVNFDYDANTQQIILNLVDGTTQYIDLSALITHYEFVDSDTIAWEVTTDGKVKAKILDGSITENMLQPNYLAEIKVESAKAETNAIKSQSYAVGGTASRQNEDIDNARYYYEQAKSISESFSGALVPMGTVSFENLPSLEDAVSGWMYNISNEFVTTDDFKEGAGYTVPLGANVFKTFDGFWDVLAGSPVTGVKGNSETSYRRGNVNITKANIGLDNVDNTADDEKSVKSATQDGNGNIITNTYAKKSIYDDTSISIHRKANTEVGNYSIAIGDTNFSSATGINAVAIGGDSQAVGSYGVALGPSLVAYTNQLAIGHYNNPGTASTNTSQGTSTGTAFVIGNGSAWAGKSNAFRVTGEGNIYATNSSINTGADYAEYFEWVDGNTDNEDRVGRFVTFDESNPEKIRFANENDYVLGIVSGMPSIIGNGDECWKQRYILDEFGRYITEKFEYEEIIDFNEETGEEITETKMGTRWKENPDYDDTKSYIQRAERSEWSAIGMMGVLSVYDDGTCQVNGYCKCTDGGIATACERGADTYRVIARVTDNIVKIVLKS